MHNDLPQRDTYHHGDLKRAVLEAGLVHARTGGPDSVTLREIARECGVTVPAVYRHYADRDALLGAIAMAAQAQLAERMKSAVEGLRGMVLLYAVGMEYIRFALDEPGLFAAAFTIPPDLELAAHPDAAGTGGLTPFQLLNLALDQMVDDGLIDPESRPGAEVACWAMVHGYGALATTGPLRSLTSDEIDELAQKVVAVAAAGVMDR